MASPQEEVHIEVAKSKRPSTPRDPASTLWRNSRQTQLLPRRVFFFFFVFNFCKFLIIVMQPMINWMMVALGPVRVS